MGKEKFVYNVNTLRYEKVEETWKSKIFRIFSFVAAVLVFAVVILFIAYSYFDSPKEKLLKRDIQRMKQEIELLTGEVDGLGKALGKIHERDQGIYRIVLEQDLIDEEYWNSGRGGTERYKNLRNLSEEKMLTTLKEKIFKLRNQMKVQIESHDKLVEEALNKEKMLSSIPSMKPINKDKLKKDIKLMSGFGMRIHPILKVKRMHTGIDFTASTGTPIYATGDGTVVRVESRSTGYGKNVVIDHGYGYQTLYAHMSKFDVKLGQVVTRGMKIGDVGSTGTSTAPHLHYEVMKNKSKVDPIHFIMDGLDPDEYAGLVERASLGVQSFD